MATAGAGLDMSSFDDEAIDRLSLSEAVAVIARHKIKADSKDITTLPDIHCVIKLHALKQKGQTKDAASLMLLELRKHDEIRRHTLQSICDRVREEANQLVVNNLSVHQQLEINLPQYTQKMKHRLEQLEEPQCSVLVVGESSAGKSSFINLLLGEEILPCYHLSNTSVICEIEYSEAYEAVIYPWQGEQTIDIIESNRDEFVKKLACYIQEKKDRDKWKYKRAKIGLPCQVLKTGLRIVDSPGIGENKELSDLVLNYMFKSFAFVYIINSSNAGGLQSDKVRALVSQLVEERKKESDTHFLPQSAIFICNKWDMVNVDDRDEVMFETKKKLKHIWPGFEEGQVYRMSTKEAIFMMRNNYTSSQLMEILRGLQTMIPYGQEGRISYSFDYFTFLVQRVIKSSLSHILSYKLSEETQAMAIRESEVRLRKLKQEADEFFKTQRLVLERSKSEVVQRLKEHFEDPVTILRICTWKKTDLPHGTTWKEVELSIRAKTYERITTEVTRLEEEFGFFRKKRKAMLDDFCNTFMILERKLLNIEDILTGNNDFNLSQEVVDDTSILSSLGWSRMSRTKKIIIGVSAPVLAPIALVGLIFSLPVLGLVKLRENIMMYKIRENIQEYNSNPHMFMERYSQEILKKFLTDSNLNNFVKEELQVIYQFIDQLQRAERKQRESDVFLVNKLQDESLKDDGEYSKSVALHNTFSDLMNRLNWFKVTQMLRGDRELVQTNTVDMPFESISLDRNKIVCTGIKAIVYKGSFCGDDSIQKNVSIRIQNIPLSPSNISQYLQEEQAYRYAKGGSNLINLLTVTKDLKEVFQVFDDLHSSLRMHLSENKLMEKGSNWDIIANDIAVDICDGLVYIHRRNRVHFDLSLDTVGVTSDGRIKLTNISCPTTLDDLTRREFLGRLNRQAVYLPPELISNQHGKYDKKSDIYAFGLLLWELSTGDRAFNDMLSDPNKGITTSQHFFDALAKTSARNALYVDYRRDISPKWQHIIANCLVDNPSIRRTSNAALDCLKDHGVPVE